LDLLVHSSKISKEKRSNFINKCFRKIFEAIDANNDGTIEFNELIVVMLLMSRVHNLGTKLALAFDM